MASRRMLGGRGGIGRGETRRVVSQPDDSDDDNNRQEVGQQIAPPQGPSLDAQIAIAMADLGSDTRARITADDMQYIPRLAEHRLNGMKKANQEGTEEHLARQRNEGQTSAWNTFQRETPQDHEDFDDINGGQSHRARMMQGLEEERSREAGGLNIDNSDRHGSQSGAPYRSTGHGHRASRSVGRGGGFAGGLGRSSPIRNTNRPLDPAIDPERAYGYNDKGGWKPVAQTDGKIQKDVLQGKSYSGGGGRGGNPPQFPTSVSGIADTNTGTAPTDIAQQAKKGGQIQPRRPRHELPAWLHLEENPVSNSGERSQDQKIVDATASMSRLLVSDNNKNKSPGLASKHAGKSNIQTQSSNPSNPFTRSPLQAGTTSEETLEGRLRNHASEALRRSAAAAKPAPSQAKSVVDLTSKTSLVPNQRVSKTENLSPLGAASQEFMSRVNQSTFDPSAYGRPSSRSNAAAVIAGATEKPSGARESSQEIRQIPVAELASTRQDDKASLTDGRPTPQSLASGFSSSVSATPTSVSVPTFAAEASTQGVAGLGIQLGATNPFTSPMMDEPLIDFDVTPKKANQQAAPIFIEIDGQKYVLASSIPSHVLAAREEHSATRVNPVAPQMTNARSGDPGSSSVAGSHSINKNKSQVPAANPFSSSSASPITSVDHRRTPSVQRSFDHLLNMVVTSQSNSASTSGGSGSPLPSNPFTNHGSGLISTARTPDRDNPSLLTGMNHTLAQRVPFQSSPRKQESSSTKISSPSGVDSSAKLQPDPAPKATEASSTESTPLIDDSDTDQALDCADESSHPAPEPETNLSRAAAPAHRTLIQPAMRERSPNVRSPIVSVRGQSIIGDTRNVMGFMNRRGRSRAPAHTRNPSHQSTGPCLRPGFAQLLADFPELDRFSFPSATAGHNATVPMPGSTASVPVARDTTATRETREERQEDHRSDTSGEL